MLSQKTLSFTSGSLWSDHVRMKILITTSRVLLGLILKVFGLNGFLHFVPTAVANPLIGPLFASHYPRVVFAVAAIGSTFLLVNRYMPVALTLLSPVIANIVLLHLFSTLTGLPIALLVALLWLAVLISERSAFQEFVTKARKRISAFRLDSNILQEEN
jgi:putative oxidoreductase